MDCFEQHKALRILGDDFSKGPLASGKLVSLEMDF
jgi:hypothetical protein